MLNRARRMMEINRARVVCIKNNGMYYIYERGGDTLNERGNERVQILTRMFRESLGNQEEVDFNTFLNETLNQYREPIHPAPQNIIDGLEEMIVNSSIDEKCVICLEGLVEGDKLLTLPCGHSNHKTCLLPWFREHDTCPECRYRLE